MYPFSTLIVLAILLGAVIFIAGLLTRKRWPIYVGAPAAAFLLTRLVIESVPPNSNAEFIRLFGRENYQAAREIKIIKPMFMGGHFISFRMTPGEFRTRILPMLNTYSVSSTSTLLHGEKLPKGWPVSLEETKELFGMEANGQDLTLVYREQDETAYASVTPQQW